MRTDTLGRRINQANHPKKHGGWEIHRGTYQCWLDMRQRCSNPNNHNFKNYGARGITVCESWDDFANFLADMGERPAGLTLDRIDNDGNYCPENCRWATRREQRINQRTCCYVEYQGERMTFREAANRMGIHEATLHYRVMHKGMTLEEAAAKPIRRRKYAAALNGGQDDA